jgi:hypothetical protein
MSLLLLLEIFATPASHPNSTAAKPAAARQSERRKLSCVI